MYLHRDCTKSREFPRFTPSTFFFLLLFRGIVLFRGKWKFTGRASAERLKRACQVMRGTCRKPVKRRDGRVYFQGRKWTWGDSFARFSPWKTIPPRCGYVGFLLVPISLSALPSFSRPYLRIPNRLQTTATVLQAANYTPTTTLSRHVNVRAQDCWITPVRNLPPENTALPFSKTIRMN